MPDIIHEIRKFNPVNGSYFDLNGYNYKIISTCSIDYFIIIISIVGKFNKNIATVDHPWKKLISDLSEYLFTKNSWDLARLSFLVFKNHIKYSFCNNEFLYDCFLSEYDI